MKKIHCISVPKSLLPQAPADIEDQVKNEHKLPLSDMSTEALEVFRRCWDPEVDGGPWPPPFFHVLLGFVEEQQ